MNQGRIWCVVHPTVGLPLLLGSVAVTSLIVHASVLTHVSWFGSYWQGKAKTVAMNGSPASVASASSEAQPGFVISVNPVAAAAGSNATSFVVTVAPSQVVAASQVQRAQATPPPESKVDLAAK
jgi:light-harvesting protein B-800-850 alpha chain